MIIHLAINVIKCILTAQNTFKWNTCTVSKLHLEVYLKADINGKYQYWRKYEGKVIGKVQVHGHKDKQTLHNMPQTRAKTGNKSAPKCPSLYYHWVTTNVISLWTNVDCLPWLPAVRQPSWVKFSSVLKGPNKTKCNICETWT